MIKKEKLLKKGLKLTDVGYSKDFTDKNGNSIMVEFNLLGGNILIVKDMFDKEKYLSTKEYDSYEEKYSDEEGYGKFYKIYIEDFANNIWDIIGQDAIESNSIVISDKGREAFDENTLKVIQELFIKLNN